jgi:hypothetical protein
MKGNTQTMRLVVQPHVAASLLDHYQGKIGKNCRGWLIGTVSATEVTATNFVPDTFNIPQNQKSAKDMKLYSQKLQSWVESIKAMFPREDGDLKIVGFYSVGSGAAVPYQSVDGDTEYSINAEYSSWSKEYARNGSLVKLGASVHLDIRVPSVADPTLRFLGQRYEYGKDYKAGGPLDSTDIEVKIAPETLAANTVADHIVRAAYGETAESTSVQVLNLDRVLSETTAPESGADERIKNIFSAFEASISSATSPSVTALVSQLKQQQAEACAVNGENLSEVRKQNALMIKLVVTRMQEYLQALEQSLVRGGPRGRFDRR